MTLEALYQDMKDALDFLGLAWGEKELATVTLDRDELVISYGGRSCRVQIEPHGQEGE